MSELFVYYCPRCGHFGYFKMQQTLCCPLCESSMRLLNISCEEFMKLSCDNRSKLMIGDMLSHESAISQTTRSAFLSYGHHCISASLISQIHDLSEENVQLNNTIQWMHDTIWELLGKIKEKNN